MKTKPQNEPDPALDRTLREWQVQAPLPPRFHERVWQRLDRAQSVAPANRWARFSNWLAGAMSRPALALSYIAIFLLLGLTAGYWQAQARNARTSAELGARYVQMMDPYRHPGR